MNHAEQPIACDLTVFSSATRAEIGDMVPDLFQSVQAVQELADGYAFQFPNEPGMFMGLATFVEHERQCCPFYSFTLGVMPNGGPIWLRMTGRAGVKEFMQVAWGDLQEAVAKKLVQTGPDHDLDDAIARAAPVLENVMKKAESNVEERS